jgi:hypothetical protein
MIYEIDGQKNLCHILPNIKKVKLLISLDNLQKEQFSLYTLAERAS